MQSQAEKRPRKSDQRASTSELRILFGKTQDEGADFAATELERIYLDMVDRLATTADEETATHIARVTDYVRCLTTSLGLEAEQAELIACASAFHDIGKIGVPRPLLGKSGPLAPEERAIVERHTVIGAVLLSGSTSPLLKVASEIALTHHERWDGTGYPQGLRGKEIPLAGRIVALADQYDALRSSRTYKKPLDHRQACAILLEGNPRTPEGGFDPWVLGAFRQHHRSFERIFDEADPEPLAFSRGAGPTPRGAGGEGR